VSKPSHPIFRHLVLFVALYIGAGMRPGFGCSPALPLPTLREEFAETTHVYLARLLKLKRSPLPTEPDLDRGALEDATFEVLLTLKGKTPTDRRVRTRTEYWGGNCTRSVLVPIDVVGRNGKLVSNPYSDVWILFLEGKEPFALSNLGHSMPANLFNEADLRFLLGESQKLAQPNNSLERTRAR
jgi:hypothetical protein